MGFFLVFKNRSKNKAKIHFFTETSLLFFLWSAWSLLSFFWSPSDFYGMQKVLCYLAYPFSGFLIGYYIIGTAFFRIKRFLMGVGIFAGVIHLGILGDFWKYGINFKDLLKTNYLVTGQTLGAGFLIFLVYALNNFSKIKGSFHILSQEKKTLIKEFFLLLGASTLLYASLNLEGRGPVLAVGTSAFILYLLAIIYRPSFLLLKQILLFCLIFMGVFYGLNHLFDYPGFPLFMERTDFLLKDPLTALFSHMNITVLFEYYDSAFKVFLKSPFLGGGFGGCPLFHGFGDSVWQLHNIFLEVLLETGLIGFLLFIGFLFSAVRRTDTGLSLKNPLEITPLILLIFGFLNTFNAGDLNDNVFFFVMLALVAGISRTKMTIFDQICPMKKEATL